MPSGFDHGPRLTQREYEQAVVALYSSARPNPGSTTQESLSRRELDLTIDFRLGTAFPSDRRDQLWRAQRKIAKSRLRMAASSFASFLKPRVLYRRANRVARFVVDEYAKVLTEAEMEAYFGADEIRRPTLPFDR
jgi:hypothetical protein